MGAFLMVMTQTLTLLTTPHRLETKQISFSHPACTVQIQQVLSQVQISQVQMDLQSKVFDVHVLYQTKDASLEDDFMQSFT